MKIISTTTTDKIISTTTDKILFTISIIVGILTTVFCVGWGILWYNTWNPIDIGTILMAYSTIILVMPIVDVLVWLFIMSIIGFIFFDWGGGDGNPQENNSL